jgi:glyoxalase superfamily protein
MTTHFQVAIDAADPHALNRFWSAAMGYEMEDHHDLVKQLLDAGQVTPDDTVELDGRLAFNDAAACRDPDGVAPRLLFQTVPEGKASKARVAGRIGLREADSHDDGIDAAT